MKKGIVTIILAVFAVSVFATGIEKDYVVTKDGVSFYEKMNYSINSYLTAQKSDDVKVKYLYSDVLEYKKDGNVYHKKDLSVVGNDKGNAFFKLIKTRGGFNLYVHEDYDLSGQFNQSVYIFKGKEFVFELNDKNALQIMSFFNRV